MADEASTPDEAIARLRAADPAAGTEPDGDRLEALTAERRADRPDELAARRGRRPARWVAVAAVAAGALVVGGTSFGLGRASVETGGAGEGMALQHTIGRSDMAGAEAMTSLAYPMHAGFSGRTTFTGQGLSTEGGSAEAWAYDGASVFSAETVVRVAQVFGVEGEPREEGGWNVGPVDGTGRTLHVGPDSAVTIMFNDPELYTYFDDVQPLPMPAPDDAAAAAEPQLRATESDGEGAEGSPGVAGVPEPEDIVAPAPGPEPTVAGTDAPAQPQPEPTGVEPAEPPVVEPAEPTAPTDQPTAVEAGPDGAAGILHETLSALGLDPDAVEYEVQEDHWAGEEVTGIVGHQLVDGRRSGQMWSVQIVDGQILAFSGPLAPLVPLGAYDVVSPAEAVERLGDPRFGATPGWSPEVEIMPYLPEASGRNWDDPPAPPPEAGAAISWPVNDVTIVSAEPVLLEQHTADGAMVLLPGYDLGDAEGRTWRVLAVADHELAF